MRTLIVFACFLVLAATLGTVVVGLDTFEGIVVDKPYEAGLAWDQTQQQTEKLGWSVALLNTSFKTGRNMLSLVIVDRASARLGDATVMITVSRPSTRKYDRTYTAERQPDKSYRASIDLPLPGNWDIISTVDHRSDHASFKNTAYADQGST